MSAAQVTAEEVKRLCGMLPDWKVVAIIETMGTIKDLEEAMAWSSGDDETTPHRHLRPQGAASRIYDILNADEEFDEDEAGGPR